MNKWLEAAKVIREVMDTAGSMLTEAQAAKVPTLYAPWKPDMVITQEMIDTNQSRYQFGGKVYFAYQPHTSQADWTPDIAASLYKLLDVEHAGTIDDPIPAAVGLTYKKDLYYLEGETLYLCIRQDTNEGTTLHFLPSALVGNYFEIA